MKTKKNTGKTKSSSVPFPGRSTQSYRPLVRPGELEKISAYGGKLLNPHKWNWQEDADEFFYKHVVRHDEDSFVLDLKTDRDEAQAKVYEALSVASSQKRIELLQDALELSGNCIDAFIVLAQETEKKTEKGVLSLYRQAVQSGRRLLGIDFFKKNAGLFWYTLEGRSFLRALYGLGETLWYEGHEDESFECFSEILRLDPRDHLQARHFLVPALLDGGRCHDARHFLALMGDEPSTVAKYSWTLLLYLENGDPNELITALQAAFAFNPWVPMCLNFEIGDFFNLSDAQPGSVEEAVIYAHNWGTTWYWKANGRRPVE